MHKHLLFILLCTSQLALCAEDTTPPACFTADSESPETVSALVDARDLMLTVAALTASATIPPSPDPFDAAAIILASYCNHFFSVKPIGKCYRGEVGEGKLSRVIYTPGSGVLGDKDEDRANSCIDIQHQYTVHIHPHSKGSGTFVKACDVHTKEKACINVATYRQKASGLPEKHIIATTATTPRGIFTTSLLIKADEAPTTDLYCEMNGEEVFLDDPLYPGIDLTCGATIAQHTHSDASAGAGDGSTTSKKSKRGWDGRVIICTPKHPTTVTSTSTSAPLR